MPPGRVLILAGLFLILLGLLVGVVPKIHFPLGRLPGDLHIQKENFTFSFPIVTCLILSFFLTLLLNLFFRR